jgi:multisubunit Na+/H+ antiporter MnhB subunit
MSPRKLVPGLLCLLLTGLLGWALAAMPQLERVAPLVAARLEASGVSNPVTAVLLNFRGYDTLLEVSVLLLAAVGAVLMPAEGPAVARREQPHYGPVESEMLRWYVRRLAPVVMVFGGYLWWTGASDPGGAFQAGAVFAGGAALLLLAHVRTTPAAGWMRPALTAGLLVFLAGAIAPLLLGNAFLDYPQGWSKAFIAVIEAFAVISIAAGLTVLMAGAPAAEEGQGR